MGKTIINLALNALTTERARWMLWLPVGLAAGALWYFSLRSEPSSAALLPLLGLPLLLRSAWRRRWPVCMGLLAIACVVATGFVLAKLATDRSHITMLSRELQFATLRGQVIEIGDEAGGKLKLTIAVESIEGLTPEETPQRVRVSYRGKDAAELLTGQQVELRAGLLPPSGPVMPGAFDFARYFYFKAIGAVGYAVPPMVRHEQAGPASWRLWLMQQRQLLSRHIRAQMAPTEGAIAAALMMGDRAGIPQGVNQDMRNANLSHILSISGMHMVILTGMVFLSLRYGLLLLPRTRHLAAGKKIAALGALAVGAAYLLVSGMPPSAVRAWIMVAFLFGAVLLGREVMPMRSLALAACAMLIWWPPMVLDPGFQLSFLATAALIAWYEWVRAKASAMPEPQHWRRRTAMYLGGILATSLVAESATAPLVLYHFNSVSVYGMVANLVVSPLVTFVMMPAIILAYLLMPLGADGTALWVLEQAIAAMVRVSSYVSSMPAAQFYAQAMPGWGCALALLGMCWIMLWQRRIRWLGALAVVAGCAPLLWQQMPDVYVSQDGRQIAARLDDELMLLRGRARSFVPMQWANVNGTEVLPVAPKGQRGWRCDARGCVLSWHGKILAISDDAASLEQDCARADILISSRYISHAHCSHPQWLMGRAQRERNGHQWLWVPDDGRVLAGNTRKETGDRPWTSYHARSRRTIVHPAPVAGH